MECLRSLHDSADEETYIRLPSHVFEDPYTWICQSCDSGVSLERFRVDSNESVCSPLQAPVVCTGALCGFLIAGQLFTGE